MRKTRKMGPQEMRDFIDKAVWIVERLFAFDDARRYADRSMPVRNVCEMYDSLREHLTQGSWDDVNIHLDFVESIALLAITTRESANVYIEHMSEKLKEKKHEDR